MADTVNPSDNLGKGVKAKPKGWEKYKWWIIGGGIVILLLLFFFLRSGSSGGSSSSQTAAQNAAQQAAQQQAAADQLAEQNAASASQLSSLGGSGSFSGTPGPAGPAGPTGPAGAAGASGSAGATGPGTYAAQGNLDLNRIAMSLGTTEAKLIALNPSLKSLKVSKGGKKVNLIGSGVSVPKGTVINVPAGSH